MTGDHQLAGKRPRLAGDVADVAHADAGFLQHLARDRFLDSLARLDEPGQRRIAALGKTGLAAKQQMPLALDQHDGDGVGARKLLGAALRAIALPAALGEQGGAAALRAEAVPRMPVEQAARTAVKRQLVKRQVPERGPGLAAGVGWIGVTARRHRGEQRFAFEQAEKHRLDPFGHVAEAAPLQALVLAEARDQAFQPQDPGVGMGQLGQQPGIAADVVGAVERMAGEGGLALAHLGFHAAALRERTSRATAAGKVLSSG